jgi:hypothetical protein
MKDDCEKTRSVALPWFEATSTSLGLAQEIVAGLTPNDNPHTFLELGCCYATAGDLQSAEEMLRRAVSGFQNAYDEMPERDWALAERSRAEQLASALANRSHASLLSQWRDQTIVKLKLHRLRS